MSIPADVARSWSRAAAKGAAMFVVSCLAGLAILWLTPGEDDLWPIVGRFVGLLLFYGGAPFAWATGTLAIALALYARRK